MKRCLLCFALLAGTSHSQEIAGQFTKHPIKQVAPSQEETRSNDYGIKQIEIEHRYGWTNGYETFIVNSDGTFRYRGEKPAARRRGDWHGTVEPWRVQRVLRYVSEIGFFTLKDQYDSQWSDQNLTYTMVVTGRRKKIVSNYGNAAPGRISALEDLMDALLEHAKWKRN